MINTQKILSIKPFLKACTSLYNEIVHFIWILPFVILTGCSPTYTYWDISKFEIIPEALQDGEEIKLIYASRGPDSNKDMEYYYHLVVVSQKTGDTINVLTTANNGFNKTNGDTVFNYFDQNNLITQMSNTDVDLLINDEGELTIIAQKPIMKVARDPEFDEIADNDFPTVIGSIGKFTSGEDYD